MRLFLPAAAAIVLAGCSTPGQAFDPFRNGPDLWRETAPKPVGRAHRAPRVKSYVRRQRVPVATVADARCLGAIAIVGDQATSQDGAKEQARKAWAQEVRFRSGERFADLRHADEIQFACVRSSVENVANRVTEAIGVNSQLKRCQISARPCRAAFEKEMGQ